MSPPEPRPIRVLLVDDHEVTRVGLRTILLHFPQLEVVGEAGTAAGAVQETLRLKPDLVVLDVRLPDQSGFEACRQILRAQGGTKVLFLTSYADDDTVFQCIGAGADGFLLKEINADALAWAICDVASGKGILDPTVTQRVLARIRTEVAQEEPDKFDRLSAQELRVLALVAQGKTNKEIGGEFGLSPKTVKNYFSNILDKLQVSRRSAAAAFYVHHLAGKAAPEAAAAPGSQT